MKESLCIILNQFKKEYISEEEAVKLIEDLYNKTWVPYSPWTIPTYPSKPWTTEPIYKYEVTCSY